MTPVDCIGGGAVLGLDIGAGALTALCGALPSPDGTLERLKVATPRGVVVLHCRALGCGVFRWDYTGEIEEQ